MEDGEWGPWLALSIANIALFGVLGRQQRYQIIYIPLSLSLSLSP
jgi:hypothetical protein